MKMKKIIKKKKEMKESHEKMKENNE